MSFKPSKRRHSHHEDSELNLLPMMNMFIIIITFLMTTAVFAKTAIIDVFLPQEGGSNGGQPSAALPAILTVSVTDKGFELGGVGGGRSIPKKDGNFDYSGLSSELNAIKNTYPAKEDVVLMFPAAMPYDIVVKTMDASREIKTEKGKKALFPQVSLGEVK